MKMGDFERDEKDDEKARRRARSGPLRTFSESDEVAAEIAQFQPKWPFPTATRYAKDLTDWYEKAHRALPWRKTRDPYAIWVSEIMLQQTQVATVIPYFEKFLRIFPTITHLAEAPLDSVLAAWSGLGYYRRARHLHEGARYVCRFLKGTLPRDPENLRKIPGIGAYTAGAIASIAYNVRAPIVDGNVVRVFARFCAIQSGVKNSAVQKKLWKLAQDWVNETPSPGVLNQALMELGSEICTKHSPKCSECPLSEGCVAFRKDLQEKLPKMPPRKKMIHLYWAPLLFCHQDKAYFIKDDSRWCKGLWNLPRVEARSSRDIEEAVKRALCDLEIVESVRLHSQNHVITHHRIELSPWRVELKKRSRLGCGRWFREKEMARLGVSSLVNKVLKSSGYPSIPFLDIL